MIAFTPDDPFPLFPLDSHSYAEAQAHSAKVDLWLGFEIEKIEAALTQTTDLPGFLDQQLWIGLPAKKMLTPYTEIRALLACLDPRPGSRIVDLGAGYGRMGFVMGRHYPEVHFKGYEYVKTRVIEGQRCLAKWNYPHVEMKQADLSRSGFSLEPADIFFIYDYGTLAAVEKTLCDLKEIALKLPITVIGRGRLSRDTIERSHPWLSQVAPPQHYPHYSIYRSGM